LNVGNFHGGLNVNSVPDRAEIGIDLRTLPGMRHAQLFEQLGSYLGPDVELGNQVDVESVWTPPDDPWMQDVFAACLAISGRSPVVEAAPYFTDASALTPALGGVPTVILGPGPTQMAHQTDEWCEVARIEEATRIYELIIRSWCGIAV
jgi:succinyl-diaminopimelate desuccinylase